MEIKPSVVRFVEVSFRNYLVNWGYMAGIGIRIIFIRVASRAQWMIGIFAVGLQMAIKLNQVKSS